MKKRIKLLIVHRMKLCVLSMHRMKLCVLSMHRMKLCVKYAQDEAKYVQKKCYIYACVLNCNSSIEDTL